MLLQDVLFIELLFTINKYFVFQIFNIFQKNSKRIMFVNIKNEEQTHFFFRETAKENDNEM